jgi:hypothetical protein
VRTVQRRRFVQLAAVVVLGVGVPAVWSVGRRGDDSPRGGAAVALEPLFQRMVVPPGGDPSAVPLIIEAAEMIEIDRTGALLVHVGTRVGRHRKPRAYQDISGRRSEVSVRFDIPAAGDPRLVVGPYDRTFPLVIEPEVGEDHLRP